MTYKFTIEIALVLGQFFEKDGCRFESNCPLVGPGTIGGAPSVGGLSKGS